MKMFRKRADDEDDDDDEDEAVIKVVNNNIYFYGSISEKTIVEFNTKLKEKEIELLKIGVELGIEPVMNIYIQSGGGDVYAGLSAMDHIYNCRVHVNTVADGCVASAATFMLLGGHSRYILEHSYLLIHQIRTGFWGRWEDLKDEHKHCEDIMNTLKKVYKDNTKLTDEKLEELFKREIYFTAKETVDYGIAEYF
jgi:ATP-dependent Clp endopeptidase proteolytic subunit ClpP